MPKFLITASMQDENGQTVARYTETRAVTHADDYESARAEAALHLAQVGKVAAEIYASKTTNRKKGE